VAIPLKALRSASVTESFETLGKPGRARVRPRTGRIRRAVDRVRRREDPQRGPGGYGSRMERRLRILIRSAWTVPVLVLGFSQWEVWVTGPTNLVGPRWAAAASMAAGSLLLAGRRRAPLAAQAAAAVVTGLPWLVWGSPEIGSSFFIGVVSTYAVGRWARRPAAYLGVPVAAGWALLQIARDPLQAGVAAGWGWALYAVVSWAAGAWVRQNDELTARRDAERVAGSRAELAEQRLQIARDLHDVLANSIGVMVVHAEAAEEILADDPDRAARAMRRVQTSGRDALREIRGLLGALRADPNRENAPRPPLDPGLPAAAGQPSYDVDHIFEVMRAAGLPLGVTRQESRTLPAAAAEVVYRVLQESLTNTLRHAGLVSSQVRLVVRADSVWVEVTDEGGTFPVDGATGGGNGLAGMRERVQRLGGTLRAGPGSAGGFAVRADLPLDPDPAGGLDATRALEDARVSEGPR
jgi:signal transduction histidine kinase